MAWYRTGTVAVTNGSAVVTGTGTAFVANVQPGHAINLPDGKVYEVLEVNSDNQITLGSNYGGSTATGQAYSVQPNQGFSQRAAAIVATFLSTYSGLMGTVLAGKFPDGTVAAPSISYAGDQDTGFYRSGSNALGIVCGGVQVAGFSAARLAIAGDVQISGGNTLGFYNPAGGADQKYARLYALGNNVILGLLNDAYSAELTALRFDRSGYTPTFASFGCAVVPLADAVYALGGGGNRWSTIYASTGAINTSDATTKTAPKPFDDALLDAWADVDWVQFQFLASIEEKGADKARWHFGVIAQQVHNAFAAHGIDGTRYGVLCYDRWDEQAEVKTVFEPGVPAQVDAEGRETTPAVPPKPATVLTPARPAGELWGIRYDLAQAIEAAFQRRRADRLEARADRLEARLTAVEAKLAA